MNKISYILLAFCLICSATGFAQKKRTTKKKQTKSKTEVIDEKLQERLRSMASVTQDIVVIDSIVVKKENFLKHYKLSADAGKISLYKEFFNSKAPFDSSFIYINEMGDKCYYSQGDTLKRALYTRDLVGGEWTVPAKLEGIDNAVYTKQNFPFMMPDGVTFYFASTGEESIGGLDIFITRYDSEDNRFFTPENIGMPFNSTANDYMYAIDEMNQIGWFASDRNQPKDTVCIYIFIPQETRNTYSNKKYTEEQITALSQLKRIADTWRDGTERKKALKRLEGIKQTSNEDKPEYGIHFFINDQTTYTSLNDFKIDGNKEKFIQILELRQLLKKQTTTLTSARENFRNGNSQEKSSLKTEIINSERNVESIERQIKDLEKEIRNSEISNIKNKNS